MAVDTEVQTRPTKSPSTMSTQEEDAEEVQNVRSKPLQLLRVNHQTEGYVSDRCADQKLSHFTGDAILSVAPLPHPVLPRHR